MFKTYLCAAMLAVASVVSSPVCAGVVTLDFNSGPGGFNLTKPYFEKGFRIFVTSEPIDSAHYDLVSPFDPDSGMGCPPDQTVASCAPMDGTRFFGTDEFHILSGNIPFLLDRSGAPFSPISFVWNSDFLGVPLFDMVSSKGGTLASGVISDVNALGTMGRFTFGDEDAWDNITSILLTSLNVNVNRPLGFDNFQFQVSQVSEPSSLVLLVGALLLLGTQFRRIKI